MNLTITSMLLLSLLMPFAQGEGNVQNEGSPETGLVFTVEAEPGAEQAEIRLRLENKRPQEAKLEFPTSQFYDAVILDENGSEVYSFSKGRYYLQAFQTVTVPAGETKVWKEYWNYAGDGIRVPGGTYKIAAALRAVKVDGIATAATGLTAETAFDVPAGQREEKASEEDAVFTAIHSEGSRGAYTVTGKARPRSGSFYYTVEDGHNQLVPETKVAMGTTYPEWGEFKIALSLSPDQLPLSGTLILNVYEKEGEAMKGEPVAIVLEQFKGGK